MTIHTREIIKMREGEKNGRAVATWEIVNWMRQFYGQHRQKYWNENRVRDTISIAHVAARSGLSYGATRDILKYRSWKAE